MSYDLSKLNLPPGVDGVPSARIGKDTSPRTPGQRTDAPKTGYDLSKLNLPEVVELPRMDLKEATEKIRVKDWGRHVRGQVEAALNRSDREGFNTLFHAIGSAKGLGLLAGPALHRFEELGQGFLHSKNPKLFFTTELVSFLNALSPERRKKQ